MIPYSETVGGVEVQYGVCLSVAQEDFNEYVIYSLAVIKIMEKWLLHRSSESI